MYSVLRIGMLTAATMSSFGAVVSRAVSRWAASPERACGSVPASSPISYRLVITATAGPLDADLHVRQDALYQSTQGTLRGG